MSETIRYWLEDVFIALLVLALFVAIIGFLLAYFFPFWRFTKKPISISPLASSPQTHHNVDFILRITKVLENQTNSLPILQQEVDYFLEVFSTIDTNIEDCGLILSLALQHSRINAALILRLERCFKEKFKEEAKYFEQLVLIGLKKR
ncbi:hypothetical protein CCZ01_08615 [Helicobacter monodelphidis]|uniref:hypothetical protein n=1 Tax=Helicobacter sp. 15-1451 TaxID=2004995 RepID=UPI000DCB9A65|nr:hypothetical protein [Helicobacter sp. 15-1451]RAX56759.1 hypothetical protein CCZ01_08615 [Helicobacter sp. 15-1451]